MYAVHFPQVKDMAGTVDSHQLLPVSVHLHTKTQLGGSVGAGAQTLTSALLSQCSGRTGASGQSAQLETSTLRAVTKRPADWTLCASWELFDHPCKYRRANPYSG